MASTNHTANLGLCLWTSTDKPKRADFVSDNFIIDSAVGGHVSDSDIHVTQSEKEKLGEPFVIRGYAGTGESSYSLSVGFQPKFALVYKKNAPLIEFSSGNVILNSACAAYGAAGSKGMTINSTGITVSQSAASGGVAVNLNEHEEQYIAVAFK